MYGGSGPTFTVTGAITLNGGDSNINISNNVLAGLDYGVLIGNLPNPLPPNSNVTVNDNSITTTWLGGLRIYATGTGTLARVSYSGVLNASGNWWGSATGPTTPNNPGGRGTTITDPYQQVVFTPWLSSGVNNAAPSQPGFYGNEGSLRSSNPASTTGSLASTTGNSASTTGSGGSSGGPSNFLSNLQQQIANDLLVAQQFQGGLNGAEQQLSAGLMLVIQQSLDDALALVFDEAAMTAGSVLVLQESMLGMHDASLLSTFDALESAISNNPLASTQAGQQIIALTGAVVAAKLQ